MEPPVARSRGRPRKRRREEEEKKNENEAKRQAMGTRAVALVGKYVLKDFAGNGVFLGKVIFYECGLYRVSYEDGDFEDLDSSEVRAILVKDDEFGKDMAQRRVVLEKLVAKNSVKAELDKGGDEGKKEESAVEVTGSKGESGAENNGGEENDDDNESSSDSGLEGSEPGIDEESLPPLPEFPSSSGTIGVPEEPVSLLFAVYGFLRSFSTRLFLMPFTLDEFVGAVNCRVPNSVFDAVHVSLMKVLRRHLESLSSEGSEIASKCLG